MKQLFILKQTLCTLLFGTLIGCALTACTDEDFSDQSQGSAIGFSTSIIEQTPSPLADTRGTPITSASSLSDMGVFCYYTGFDTWSTAGSTATPDKMNNIKWTQAANAWSTTSPVSWGTDVSIAEKFTFFGYTPYATGATGNGLTVVGTTGTPKLRYTVPSTIGNQPDLMIAMAKDMHPTGTKVPLAYKHALTCLAFSVKGVGTEKITAIKVKGIRVSGDLTWASDGTPVWSNLSSPTTTEYSAGVKDGLVNVTTSYQDALATDGYLMMIPQTLQSGAQLIVSVQGQSDKVFDLTSQTTTTWAAGQRLTYNVSLSPPVITVGPDYLFVATPGSDSRFSKLEVTSSVPTEGAWTLTSSNADIKLSLSSDGTGASTTVSGVGNQTVYAVVAANTTPSIKKADIKLGFAKVATVFQASTNTYYFQNDGYGGAFWRASETGERMIRMPMHSSSAAVDGPWIMQVAWADENWDASDIVIDAPSTFPGNPYVSALGPADNSWISGSTTQRLTGNLTVAPSGTAREDYLPENFITFKVGLKSTYTTKPDAPARYAIVLMAFHNGNVIQPLLLRQGEGADYLMQTGVGDVKMSPYNLKPSTAFNAEGYTDVPTNGGVFTQYPTQVGAMFQAASTANPRRAYSPYSAAVGGWSTAYGTFDAAQETCPSGYRRPTVYVTDSDTKKYFTGAALVFCYYADGFFDRQKIEDGDVTESRCRDQVVSKDNAEKAVAGVVAYNPTTGASIFVGSGGIRYGATALEDDGYYGYYWGADPYNSSSYGNFYVSLLGSYSSIRYSYNSSYRAFPIRCVKD